MSFNLSSPVTGGAQTGFTSPTYTLTADSAPNGFGRQWAVTALGGTQAGVDVHSVSKPFTITSFRPAQLRALPVPNNVTGVIKNIPYNTWKLLVRKGALPAANNNPVINRIIVQSEVYAGTDTYESANVRAMVSLAVGALSQQSAGIGDMYVTGIH
nr:MAG: hypothetical protein 2 [Hangzhou atkins-like virus 1]